MDTLPQRNLDSSNCIFENCIWRRRLGSPSWHWDSCHVVPLIQCLRALIQVKASWQSKMVANSRTNSSSSFTNIDKYWKTNKQIISNYIPEKYLLLSVLSFIYPSHAKLIPCRLPRTWQIPWHDLLPGHGMPWDPPWPPHPPWAERSCDLITMTNTWSELTRERFWEGWGQVLCKSDQICLPPRWLICVLHGHWQASHVPSPLRAALEKNPMIDMIRSPVW